MGRWLFTWRTKQKSTTIWKSRTNVGMSFGGDAMRIPVQSYSGYVLCAIHACIECETNSVGVRVPQAIKSAKGSAKHSARLDQVAPEINPPYLLSSNGLLSDA